MNGEENPLRLIVTPSESCSFYPAGLADLKPVIVSNNPVVTNFVRVIRGLMSEASKVLCTQ